MPVPRWPCRGTVHAHGGLASAFLGDDTELTDRLAAPVARRGGACSGVGRPFGMCTPGDLVELGRPRTSMNPRTLRSCGAILPLLAVRRSPRTAMSPRSTCCSAPDGFGLRRLRMAARSCALPGAGDSRQPAEDRCGDAGLSELGREYGPATERNGLRQLDQRSSATAVLQAGRPEHRAGIPHPHC